MRLIFALAILCSFCSAPRAEDRDETYERSKYIAPAQLDGSHYLFDHNGRPTRAQKKKDEEKAVKKKKEEKKRKRLTHKPRKRRPKKPVSSKSSKERNPPASSETASEDFPPEDAQEPSDAQEPPDAQESPDGPPQGGQGLDYGAVNVEDDQKVAIPGGSGAATEEPFRPSPPESEGADE